MKVSRIVNQMLAGIGIFIVVSIFIIAILITMYYGIGFLAWFLWAVKALGEEANPLEVMMKGLANVPLLFWIAVGSSLLTLAGAFTTGNKGEPFEGDAETILGGLLASLLIVGLVFVTPYIYYNRIETAPIAEPAPAEPTASPTVLPTTTHTPVPPTIPPATRTPRPTYTAIPTATSTLTPTPIPTPTPTLTPTPTATPKPPAGGIS